jgi:hypothetical protein
VLKLDAHCRATLIAMARQLFPHDVLDDAPYAEVVRAIEDAADNERTGLLVEGVELLDSAMEKPFVNLPDERKVEVLKEMEGSDFFNDIRGATVRRLYRNPAVWTLFAYEGPSSHLGGYVKRGFDDATWVPEE